jgi:hypothetical protein
MGHAQMYKFQDVFQTYEAKGYKCYLKTGWLVFIKRLAQDKDWNKLGREKLSTAYRCTGFYLSVLS